MGHLQKFLKFQIVIEEILFAFAINGILQLVESPDYDATKDPHSLRFSGERHIEAAQGAVG